MTIGALVRTCLALCLVVVAAAPVLSPPQTMAAAGFPFESDAPVVEDAVEYLLSRQGSDGNIAGFVTSAWAVMALAAAGEADAVAGLLEYLADEAAPGSFSATDWARMILAIVAGGEDPEDFGGEDYIAGLLATYEVEDITGNDYTQVGDPELLNDDIWAILALKAAGESIDDDIVDFVQELQNPDGGWGIDVYSDSDVDVTAAAIFALKAAGLSSGSASIVSALEFLAVVQNSDGGFPSVDGGVSNAASDAWVIMAILSIGGDPDGGDWERSGGTPVDHLLSLQHSSGYFNWYSGSSSNREWMTSYSVPALMGMPYPVPPLQASAQNATIGRAPTSLTFHATEDGGSPLARTFQVWNDGDGTMQYTVSDNAAWLSVSPSSGNSSGERDEITAEADIDGLDAGQYQATVTIVSSGATNSPRTVAVTLFVDEPASDAEIAYWTEELSFTAVEGGSDPANQFIEVWNAGPGAMAWEVEVDEDWLSVSPSGGTSSGEHDKVTVSVDIDDLDTDEYQATITITSDDADNSPQTVLVVLEVTGGSSGSGDPEVSCSPSTLTFDAVEDDDDPESQTLKVWNSGEGRLDWEVSADADWLSVSPRSGTSNGEKDSVTVSVDSSGLSAGSYTGRITVQDEDDSGNRQTVRVTLSIDEPEDEEVQPAQAATYILAVTATPDGAGSISRNISAGSSGYAEGTTVTLSAAANEGYAFIGWSGDAGGSSPSTTIVMNNHRSVVARFLRFDASGLTNVKLAYIPPELTALTVMPYPVDSIPSNPPGFIINWALLVRPQGGGTFALEFSDLPNADYVGIFQVVNGTWTQVPRTVMDQATLQVSLPVTETVLAFATPGTASGQFWKKVTGFFGSIDSTTMTVIAVAAVLVVVVIVLIVFVVRRDSY